MKSAPWLQFSEHEVVQWLERFGIRHVQAAFHSGDEVSSMVRLIPAKVFWISFGMSADLSVSHPVEAKLYVPKQPAPKKRLIIFTPSYPGHGGRFERAYAYAFTEAGYYFLSLRHNGTSLTSSSAAEVMNSPRRLEIAGWAKEGHIGGTEKDGYKPSELLNGPVVVLRSVASAFDEITMLSQSFGAAANNFVVTNLGTHADIMRRIKNVVSIAGYVGRDIQVKPGLWHGTKIPAQDFGELQGAEIKKADVNFVGGVAEFLSDMRRVAQANSIARLPPETGCILYVTPDDPWIDVPNASADVLKLYGPSAECKLVISQRMPAKGDPRPHSMDWIKPDDLIKTMRMVVMSPPRMHIIPPEE